MKVRFQADADLNHILLKATLRRERGIDFQTRTPRDSLPSAMNRFWL